MHVFGNEIFSFLNSQQYMCILSPFFRTDPGPFTQKNLSATVQVRQLFLAQRGGKFDCWRNCLSVMIQKSAGFDGGLCVYVGCLYLVCRIFISFVP